MNDYGVLRLSNKKDAPGKEMKVKFIFEVKFDNQFRIKRKVRLVACGYSQIKNVNYGSTYSPTPSIMIVKLLFAIAVIKRLCIASFDIRGAFLEGVNEYPNYVYLPGILYHDGMKRRYRVLASLYGQKNAGKIFNDKFNDIVTKWGFERCIIAKTLYLLKINENEFIIINVHVDDGFVAATSMSSVVKMYDEFDKVFVKKIERFIPIQKFIGLEIIENNENNCITLGQQLYVNQILNDVNLCIDTTAKTKIPIKPGLNLRTSEQNNDNKPILEHTGKFRFLADRTRYDMLVATGELSCGASNFPSDNHISTLYQSYKYLSSKSDTKLKFSGDDLKIFGFCDASYNAGKSRLGGCLFPNLHSGAFHCFSVNDKTVSRSICESEIKAIDILVLYIIEVIEVVTFLCYYTKNAIPIYCDNEVAKEIVETIKNPNKTKHIIRIIEFLREKVNEGIIKLIFIPSELNVADVLTKPLWEDQFNHHINVLMNGFNGNEIATTYLTMDNVIEMYNITD